MMFCEGYKGLFAHCLRIGWQIDHLSFRDSRRPTFPDKSTDPPKLYKGNEIRDIFPIFARNAPSFPCFRKEQVDRGM